MARTGERGRDVGVAVLVGVLAALAVLLVVRLPEHPPHEHPLPWWLLVAGFVAAESAVIHLQVRRDSVSLSFGEIPLVLGLAFTLPLGFVLASVLGSAVVLVLQRRQRGLKLAFNLALFAVEAALGQTVYLLLVGSADLAGVQAGLATLVAVVCTDLASALAVTAVICVSTGQVDREPLAEAVTTGLVGAVANTSVALLAVVLLVQEPFALVLLLVLLAALAVVYRAYARLGRGHSRLELLYQFTRGMAEQSDVDLIAGRVLREARDVTQSSQAELVLLAAGGRPALRLRLDDGSTRPGPAEGARWWAGATHGEAVRYPRGSGEARDALAETGLADGLAAPLQIGGSVAGVLAVAGRPPFLASYSADDLRLFQSLADHAAVALQNVRLVDELRREVTERERQALHDSRTGLPNRLHLLQRLGRELTAGTPVAVVMLDLVGFGQINDALGYGTGDRVLTDVGARLVAHLGATQVARLGNDEFAALLLDVSTPEQARARTAALLGTLTEPFPVGDFALDVRAQAGVSLAPEHGTDAAQLLQRANAALATSSHDGTDLSLYSVWMDQSSARRLQLVSDLRDAIADQQLTVHYQPKVHPRTGAPLSAEALVRWTHPQLGRIGPEEFVPLAEHAGLIGDLTTLVLRAALDQCVRWHAAGHPLGIAVNLSTRSLTDPDLPERIRRELARAQLPADTVTLEITESAVMTDVQRSLDTLHRLRRLGVLLSVDDFGTGQSSLAYLQDLPVQELKIDKSFVQAAATRPASLAIARAAIDLGHALGLTTVAEGVEDEATRSRLADAGCDVLQGYLFSRPLPADQMTAWLDSRARHPAAV